MTELLVMFRNLLIAMVLGWLGLSFAPDDGQDKDNQPEEKLPQITLAQ